MLALAVVGVLAGLLVVGGPTGQLDHPVRHRPWDDGGPGPGGARRLWTVGQLAAVGAVALAVSAFTEHPLVVLAAVLGGLIVLGVLGAIPALDWPQPYLLTSGWTAGIDALATRCPSTAWLDATLRALGTRRGGRGVDARMQRRTPDGRFASTLREARMNRDARLLDDDAIDAALRDLPGWSREGDALVYTAELPTFPVAIGVVARVGEIAEGAQPPPGHRHPVAHPDLPLLDALRGRITQHDVDLATAISEQVDATSSPPEEER